METYILEDDEVGRQLADALIAKQPQGVQVNLIHDSVGTLGTTKEFFKRLSDAGINVLEFNPVNPLAAKAGWDVNQRDHRKLLVVDGQSAVLGGINISSVYSSSRRGSSGGGSSGGSRGGDKDGLPWRDTDLLIEGPGRRAAAEALHRDLAAARRASRSRRASTSRRCRRRARRSCARSAARPTSRSARST